MITDQPNSENQDMNAENEAAQPSTSENKIQPDSEKEISAHEDSQIEAVSEEVKETSNEPKSEVSSEEEPDTKQPEEIQDSSEKEQVQPASENQENNAENEAVQPISEDQIQPSSEKAEEEIPVQEDPKAEMAPEELKQTSAEENKLEPKSEVISKEKPVTEESEEIHEALEDEHKEDELSGLTLPQIMERMEQLINLNNAGAYHKKFHQLKEHAFKIIHDESEEHKNQAAETELPEEQVHYEHPSQAKLSGLISIFREKQDAFHQQQDAEQAKNLEQRQSIIERLKNLYTNSEPGVNLFKEIREIKQEWGNAGQVAKSEFKILNNNYFHHLNQFYQMLDMNKEYLEQEYSHNLEKRQHIIERAQELEKESSVQKALNELQFLHKLWKEEAEPVAEEFREKTWEVFKEISNRIHERKSELNAQIEAEQQENLEKKNNIIEEIKKLASPEKEPNHHYWQTAIKTMEELRANFLKTGNVPRKISNQNWNDFKETIRNFNSAKNEFYKNLKHNQQHNLDEKMKLIQTAKDNMHSEDWDTAVPLFKKLQDDWKTIGHVPRSMANKVWDEFREACNVFFNQYRAKNNAQNDNWKENFQQKKALLEELKNVTDDEGSVEKIEQIKTSWNNIGKVPREKIGINSEFNKTMREKMKLNKIHDYELKEDGLSEGQITDKARKIKNQIGDLEAEIVKLENNIGFFTNPSRENPLLRDTYNTIDQKKAQLESMKQSLHQIIAGE